MRKVVKLDNHKLLGYRMIGQDIRSTSKLGAKIGIAKTSPKTAPVR